MKKILAFAALSLASLAATAERADSLKQAQVDFDKGFLDEVTQTRTLTGNVVLTRGTLLIKSDKAVMKESPEGYMILVLTAAAGQARDLPPEARRRSRTCGTEGQAQRIEYDERTDLVKLFSQRRGPASSRAPGVTQREWTGAFISYDNRSEQCRSCRNDASGDNKPGGGRSTIIIAPRRTAPAAAPAQPAGAAKQ